MSKENLANRSELVFLYDIKDANPNGDPLDENRPRVDEETGENIVTDVRLKRTIRDYLHDYKGEDIFVIKEVKEDGMQKTREERIEELKIKSRKDEEKLLEKYIDLRLFGATIALEKKGGGKGRSITWTGPVQFRFGRSLHKVEPVSVKGTSVMPSGEEKRMGTFVETQILPYSLIRFYGVINENAAQHTHLTESDVAALLDGMWNGTKNLITRSKVGQSPRFLLRVIYGEKNYHIGDLDRGISLTSDLEDRAMRDISEVKLDVTKLVDKLESNRDKVEKIEYETDEDVSYLVPGGSETKVITGAEIGELLEELLEGVTVERLELEKSR